MTNAGIAALGQLTSLRDLALDDTLARGATTLLPLSRLSALTRLSAQHSVPLRNTEILRSLSALTSLRSLSIGAAENDIEVFTHLAHLTALTYLALGVVGILSAERVEKLAIVESLQHLRFSGCGYMYEDGLLVSAQMPAWRSLHVYTRSLSVAGAKKLACSPYLTSLVLSLHEDFHDDMDDSMAVLEAAPALDFHCYKV
jgi:hypothetical protein